MLDDCSTGHADSVPDGVELQQRDITEVADVLRDGGFDAVLHFTGSGESVAGRRGAGGAAGRPGRDGRARGAPAGLLLDVRLMTHLDVDDAAVTHAIEAIRSF